MTCIVKIFLFVNLIATFTINVFAYDKSMTEILKDDGEISLLYTNGTNRFIKKEDDVKAFALVESYKSHLYEIRHSNNAPTCADYTSNNYAEVQMVHTTIPTELLRFALNLGYYANNKIILEVNNNEYSRNYYEHLIFANALCKMAQNYDKCTLILDIIYKELIANDKKNEEMISESKANVQKYIEQLRLSDFIESIKKARIKKSTCDFINQLKKTKAKIVGYKLFLDIIYNNVFQDKISDKDMTYCFTLEYDTNGSLLEQEAMALEGEYPVDIHALANLGGTCWFSSSMQFLNASKDFRNFIENAARIYRNRNEAFYEMDNIFVILHNIFNLLNSNISLEPEAEEMTKDGKAAGYSKRIIEKQFSRLMKKLEIPVDYKKVADSLTFMKKILIEINRAIQVRESVQICEFNELYLKLTDSFNVFTTIKLKCAQGHVISIRNNASSIMLINMDEYKGEERDDIIKELFKTNKNTTRLAFCKKCKKRCELKEDIESKPAENLIIQVYSNNKNAQTTAQLNKERLFCPTNSEIYNVKTSLWHVINESGATQNHLKTIIHYKGYYVVADNSIVKKVSDSYEGVIPEGESEPLVLYERVH